MKNLILLTERHHAIFNNPYSKSFDNFENEGISFNNFIKDLIPNPHLNYDDSNLPLENENTIFSYVLTNTGTVISINSRNTPIWSIDLNNFTDANECKYTCDSKEGNTVYFNLYYNLSIDALIALSREYILNIEPNSGKVEVIGYFGDYGILEASWSYNGKLLAILILQRQGNFVKEEKEPVSTISEENGEIMISIVLITMNSQFEILAEVNLPFSSKIVEGEKIELCWKVDGSLLAISSLDHCSRNGINRNMHRIISIYDSETLELKSTGRLEDASGKLLPNLISVPPTVLGGGNVMIWAGAECSDLLACVQRRGTHGRHIVLIEPNGYQHGGFKLRCGVGDDVIRLDLNEGSDILSATIRCKKNILDVEGKNIESTYDKVQFYHRSNYHWYLKFELTYEKEQLTVGCVRFNTMKKYEVIVTLRKNSELENHENNQDGETIMNIDFMEWREYTFAWDASVISPVGTAAVVDGNILKFTPFRDSIVPPPMYASSLIMEAPILSVTHVPHYSHSYTSSASSLPPFLETVAYLNNGKLVFCANQSDVEKVKFCSKVNKNDSSKNFVPIILGTLDLAYSYSVMENVEVIKYLKERKKFCLRQITVVNAQRNGEFDLFVRLLIVACPKISSLVNNLSYEFSSGILSTNMDNLFDITVHLDLRNHVKLNLPNCECIKTVTVSQFTIFKLDGMVLRLVTWCHDISSFTKLGIGRALLELTTGALYEFSSLSSDGFLSLSNKGGGGGKISPHESISSIPEPCTWIAGIFGTTSNELCPLIVGLSRRSRLYCNETLICDLTSSFLLSPCHRILSYVTLGSKPQLRCLSLDILTKLDPLMGSEYNVELLGENFESRNVESGSRIVCILPQRPAVVLQLPRGNLELGFPRALVVPFIIRCIDQEEYDLALKIMRKQRVDMNLIVDKDPLKFMENGGIERMVSQVRNMDHINLFIASLKNSKVKYSNILLPSSSYRSTFSNNRRYIESTSQSNFDYSTKINQVCSKLRFIMMNIDKLSSASSVRSITENKFLLPILSTYAKEIPPKLEDALLLIRNYFLDNDTPNYTCATISSLLDDRSQNLFRYLASLSDYVLLFNTALGMYDYNLAKAVTRNSQMDPKIYLPMLNRLSSLPVFSARFEVDISLKRYESALTNLVKSHEDDENPEKFRDCLCFIEKYKLHHLALELFSQDADKYRCIMISLGEYLLKDNKPKSALAIFLAANPSHMDGAKRSSRLCGDWKSYFSSFIDSNNDQYSKGQKLEIAKEIAQEISAGRDCTKTRRDSFVAAAQILADYCKDYSGAVNMLISAEKWFDSRRLARLNSREDLVKRVVDAAVTYGQSCLHDFEMRQEKFLEANIRYAAALATHKKMRHNDEQREHYITDTNSIFSVVSTNANTSISDNSCSSTTSVNTVTSIISAETISAFKIVGEEEHVKHKSKFNRKGKSKKKKVKKGKKQKKSGSEEELKNLMYTLKANIIDEEYSSIVVETINFIIQNGYISLAKNIYDAYVHFAVTVETSQSDRMKASFCESDKCEGNKFIEDNILKHTLFPYENEINKIRCTDMPIFLHEVFKYLMPLN